MMQNKKSFTYEEENGFEITRGDDVFLVYGTCEGTYSFWSDPGCITLPNGDPGYPPEEGYECEDFSCHVDRVENTKCEVQEGFILTEEELHNFTEYMGEKLDAEAANDPWVDEDDFTPDLDWEDYEDED